MVERTIIEKKRYIIPNSQIQAKIRFIGTDTFKDDGSGGSRVESPRVVSRVLRRESIDDGNGSKGRYSVKEMDMSQMTLESL